MSTLQVTLFGGMKVVRDTRQCELRLTRTSQLLLAYLLLERHRMHSRDVLAGLFWGENNQGQARRCLNSALWRLRQAIEADGIRQGTYLVTSHTGEVGFNAQSEYWLDVAVFEECVHRVKAKPFEIVQPQEVMELEAGLQLHVSELLEGIYTDWAIRAREHKRMLHLDGLMYLMGYYKQHHAYERSLEFGQKVLDIDPLREEVHREMMRLHLAVGQRALALRQYEVCRQNLSVELGIPPMVETQALYAQILEQARKRQLGPVDGGVSDLHEVITFLQQADRNFELAQEQIQKAMRRLETIFPSEEESE